MYLKMSRKGAEFHFFSKEDLSFEQVSKNSYQAFESISIKISTEGAKDVIFHVVYRPPNLPIWHVSRRCCFNRL